MLDAGHVSAASLSSGAVSGDSHTSLPHIHSTLPPLGDEGGRVVEVEPSSSVENLNLQNPPRTPDGKRKRHEENWVPNKNPHLALYVMDACRW